MTSSELIFAKCWLDRMPEPDYSEVLEEAHALADCRDVWEPAEIEELSLEPDGICIPAEWQH